MANSWDNVVGTEQYDATLERAREFASSRGWCLNDDEERVRKVIGLMTINHGIAGDFFCPCKQSHPLDALNDTVCPCPEVTDEMEEEEHCFCRLFFKH